jgi:hypothetical protein
VKSIQHIGKSGARINGGFMVVRQQVFRYIHDGEELVEAPFQRLIDEGKLMTYPHEGYWACMDTFKEKQDLDDVFSRGRAPPRLPGRGVYNGAEVSMEARHLFRAFPCRPPGVHQLAVHSSLLSLRERHLSDRDLRLGDRRFA